MEVGIESIGPAKEVRSQNADGGSRVSVIEDVVGLNIERERVAALWRHWFCPGWPQQVAVVVPELLPSANPE